VRRGSCASSRCPGGTAKLVADDAAPGVALKTLDQILAVHPQFRTARLLKCDIDGLDFSVITASAELLRSWRPILFFEYAPMESATGPGDGLDCFRMLLEIGYEQFLVWDGFGHYLIHLNALDFDKLVDLTFFLVANRRFGAAIYHYDICAFSASDRDLFAALRQHQLGLCLA
jgi:hypothetical protein